MSEAKSRSERIKNLTLMSLLTALVAILQLLGSFIHFGTFSVSLTLIPIVIGAALCGPGAGAWLGLVFSIIVLLMDSSLFLAISPAGTILTVLAKGTLAGWIAGLVFRALEKKGRYKAVAAAAVAAPLVNTGVFLLGCRLFFFDTIAQWASAAGFGSNVTQYMIVGLVGVNFVFEMILDLVLSPVAVRLIDYVENKRANQK